MAGSHAGKLRAPLAALACAVAIAACSGGDEPVGAPMRADDRVVVASFNFPESRLLAEIYAQALDRAGVPVRRELGLGTREMVLPAVRQGFVDVVPEYLGSVRAALAGAPLRDARLLDPAPAQNQNGFVVTRATAARHDLRAVSDLAGVADRFTLGGPPECPLRRLCLLGLERVYGLRFAGFVPVEGEVRTRRALDEGVVDVGVMFTTDGSLAASDLVLLADDRGLQPAENVVPLVRERAIDRHGGRLVDVLDDVSARLTTTTLRVLNWRVTVAGQPPAAEAHGWLLRQGIIPR